MTVPSALTPNPSKPSIASRKQRPSSPATHKPVASASASASSGPTTVAETESRRKAPFARMKEVVAAFVGPRGRDRRCSLHHAQQAESIVRVSDPDPPGFAGIRSSRRRHVAPGVHQHVGEPRRVDGAHRPLGAPALHETGRIDAIRKCERVIKAAGQLLRLRAARAPRRFRLARHRGRSHHVGPCSSGFPASKG